MDEFVRGKLNEWGLSECIQIFQDEGIDEELFKGLEKEDIEKLIPKVKFRIIFRKKFKEFKCQLEQEESTGLTEVQPSTSDAGKRKRDLQGESSKQQTPAKRNRIAELKDANIRLYVKEIMDGVLAQLDKQNNTDLNQFLKKNIKDLETDKRELVGVFGKTGAGKSSLINAVIGEKNLLPSGRFSACTSVITKVESNMQKKHYEAEIEFIGKEEWKAEVWSMLNFLENNPDEEGSHDENETEDDNNDDSGAAANDDDYDINEERWDNIEKLSALYGEDWREKSCEELMDRKYFKGILPFWETPKAMILKCKTAEELSAELKKYISNVTNRDVNVRSSYWPLVKCVTVKVPQNQLLQYVTLVDIPGNGDRNKSRDTMWKQIIGNCSTVWIVSEMDRAASDKESWEILKNANSLIGNGGECRQIHFICSKSDDCHKYINCSEADLQAILNNNKEAKEYVKKEFQKLKKMKHFNFEVFAVSSKWFQGMKDLNVERTEIPKLQDVLQNLNDSHSETLNYVSGACGILSLIQGSSLRDVADKSKDVCDELDRNMTDNLVSIKQAMKAAEDTFDKQLNEGVEKSKRLWENKLKSIINPPKKRCGGFHKILKCLVKNQGIYKPKKRKEININVLLSSVLTECIDEKFRKTFPNESKPGPFNGVINKFSLGTEKLKEKYKDVELQLIFLKTEEEKMKMRLIKIIRDRKKKIYRSLTETIEQAMIECYERAATFTGRGMLNNMTETIKNHVKAAEDTLFEEAKNAMLDELRTLTEEIPRKLEDTLKKSIQLSLMINQSSPDVAKELEEVQKSYKSLKNGLNEERA